MTNPTTKDDTDMQIPSISPREEDSITTESWEVELLLDPKENATSPGATTWKFIKYCDFL